MAKYIVNTSWGNPDLYSEEIFDTLKEAKEYCKENGLPIQSIKKSTKKQLI